MKNLLLAVMLLLAVDISAQSLKGDVITTDNGDLTIQPILHGTLGLEWNGKIIYIDPYGGEEAFAGLPDPDMIVITDIHGDHLNPNTLAVIKTDDVQFIVPQAVADKMEVEYDLKIMANGDSWSWEGISIEALPMYNLPEDETSRHAKGRGNGYILTFGGKRIYISGDTEDILEMRALENIDVAFVCMNLPYTMSIDQASDAVLRFEPAVVYPFHFRGPDGLADVDLFKTMVNSKNENIEVRLREWYPGK
jgi:L-ascorbate metabolism protein UlaG (beta-lactamase superfamily)